MGVNNPQQAQDNDAPNADSSNEQEDSGSNASVLSAPENVQPMARRISPPAVNSPPVIQLPLEDLRALVREEVQLQSQNNTQLRLTSVHTEPEIVNPPPFGHLSPASPSSADQHADPLTSVANIQPPSHVAVVPPPPQQSVSQPSHGSQGNNSYSPDLPPLSANILKLIQNKEYVNFNNLLPSSLYDYNASQTSLNLQINPDDMSNNTVALTATGNKKVKINSVASWMQAWNLYIRAMIFYHPILAPELLTYQDYICGLQRSYLLTSWLRYDAAFRLSISKRKDDPTTSWSEINDSAFNQFIRCPPPQIETPKKQQCFRCSGEGYYANNCPNLPFRSSSSPQQWASQPEQPFRYLLPCRHFNKNQCRNTPCPWPHRCNRCRGNHPGSACSNPSTTVQPVTNPKPNFA